MNRDRAGPVDLRTKTPRLQEGPVNNEPPKPRTIDHESLLAKYRERPDCEFVTAATKPSGYPLSQPLAQQAVPGEHLS
jgi:hypothetical protein